MYSKIFKFNQVTYGRPFQVNTSAKTHNCAVLDDPGTQDNEDGEELSVTPEMLIEKAKQEAELIVKEAGFEAKRIINEAREEIDKEAKIKQEEAWQRGYAEGVEAAKSQYESLIAEAEEIKRSSSEEHDSIIFGMEKEIIELVLDVARKTVAAELSVNREVIMQLLRDALKDCSDKEGAVIKASPEDWSILNEHKDELMSIADTSGEIEIKKDASMKRGDLTIETKLGGVDAGVRTKFKKIEESFRELLGEK